jgi:hypothetical protein
MNTRFRLHLSAGAVLATLGTGAWAQTPTATPAIPQTGTETRRAEAPGLQPVNSRTLDLVSFATKQDLERLATKEDLKQYARKADVDALRADLERMLAQIRAIRARLAEPAQPTPANQTVPAKP